MLEHPPRPRTRPLKFIAIAIAAIAIVVLLTLRFPTGAPWLTSFQDWLGGLGGWAPAGFFAVFLVLALVCFPMSPLAVAAGAAFGLVEGVAIVSFSSTFAAAAAFGIARYTIRAPLRRRIERSPKLATIDRAIGREGWKFVALMRLSPVTPFGVQNYLYGASAINFWTCLGVTWAAKLPLIVLYVYLGAIGRDALGFSKSPSALEWAANGLGLAATILLTIYTARVARRALREAELRE